MSKMDLPLMTVQQFIEHNLPEYSLDLSVAGDEQFEQVHKLAKEMGLPAFTPAMLPHYPRYDYDLSRLVAAKFMSKLGLNTRPIKDLPYEARLGNSGMAVIRNVLDSCRLHDRPLIIGKVLYGETKDMFPRLSYDCNIPLIIVDSTSLVEIKAAYEAAKTRSAKPPVMMFETIGNGAPPDSTGMPVLNMYLLLDFLWNKPATLIIDGTFTTTHLCNPFSIISDRLYERSYQPYHDQLEVVYVESLSKYYRSDPQRDPTSGGIVIGPQEFITKHYDVYGTCGAAMPTTSLITFPFDLHEASKVVCQLSTNAQAASDYLNHQAPRVKNVWYPRLREGAGGVLYFELAGERIEQKRHPAFESVIPWMPSFGHAQTTHVYFGGFGEPFQPGLMRLAVGTCESPEEVVAKLRLCLEK